MTAGALLLDLDGTLADTAADLAAPANALREARGLPPLPLEQLRPWASHGARGLIGAALGVAPGDAGFDALRAEFLERYAAALCVHTRLFDGVEALLGACEAAGVPWGIVTNKHAVFARPVVEQLGLANRCAVLVCGDTTPRAKPDPLPLLHAASTLALAPRDCVYVGDDARDIEAGRAAGMHTVAAVWGYCSDDPARWGAELQATHPGALAKGLRSRGWLAI